MKCPGRLGERMEVPKSMGIHPRTSYLVEDPVNKRPSVEERSVSLLLSARLSDDGRRIG